jgi:hypothetical protein
VALVSVYVPMLLLVLRPKADRKVSALWKERRRPNRLRDEELKVDVAPDGNGGFTCKVTHLPSGEFVSEWGSNREQAVRKAQDKLAALKPGKKMKKSA